MKLPVLFATALVLLGASLGEAQQTRRLWYIGPFEGWVDEKAGPTAGYYYRPAPDSMYPLHESSYGQPVPCPKCGHAHWPGDKACAYCGCICPAGGNKEPETTVYSPYRLPGMYFYEQQPHFRFKSPMRLGPLQKYRYPY